MNISVNKMVKIAVLLAIAYILMLFEFPIPVFPAFLKFDLSEIPVLLAAFTMGPVAAVLIEFLKNLLHALFNTQSAWVGELANFIIGVAFVVPAALIYKIKKSRKFALTGLVAGILSMAVFASLTNYFILIPFYAKVLGFPMDAIIGMGTAINRGITDLRTLIAFGIIPFNLFKGVIISIIMLLIYKKLSPILHKENFTRHSKI